MWNIYSALQRCKWSTNLFINSLNLLVIAMHVADEEREMA
jgi:hypothetical protein